MTKPPFSSDINMTDIDKEDNYSYILAYMIREMIYMFHGDGNMQVCAMLVVMMKQISSC